MTELANNERAVFLLGHIVERLAACVPGRGGAMPSREAREHNLARLGEAYDMARGLVMTGELPTMACMALADCIDGAAGRPLASQPRKRAMAMASGLMDDVMMRKALSSKGAP